MTIAEQLRQEGAERGRLEGQRELARKILTVKFGPVADRVQVRIDAASEAQLETWMVRLLTAQSLSEALGD